jgi:ABC transport system ATP-binding/permease protein
MADAAAARSPAPRPRSPAASRNGPAQLGTLCRRYLAVIASDRAYLAALAFLPLLMGVMIRAIPSPQGLAGPSNLKAQSLLLVLAVGGSLTGTANAIRELVKERSVYERERAAGLSPGAYLLSKLVVLGVISFLQAVVMLAVGMTGRRLPPAGAVLTHLPLLELLLAVGGLSITSMALGLLVSALVNSSDKTMPLLVVSVMFQLILSGGIFALNGKVGLDELSWLSPSRWAFAATAATTNLNKIMGAAPAFGTMSADPLWAHNAHTWLLDMAILLVLGLVFALLTFGRLVSTGPARRR